ncbi:hypothetical protein U8P73_36030 (plasmid) [Rhizobium beringeri]|uniref:hypothetical protein n=1 Tax=Rhizobium beringeri TaxID=3019934 RepID=UPI002DDD6E26|nr:hypothetical protein [Rhizobium beringeri]WSG93560.1 hypothetical protein U8P73_36030 [Rhizobium beringeri]
MDTHHRDNIDIVSIELAFLMKMPSRIGADTCRETTRDGIVIYDVAVPVNEIEVYISRLLTVIDIAFCPIVEVVI